jgi:hypothetical protein
MAGPLKNARHERFAQELAKGETADAAFVGAGFKRNRGNATRLKANESVAARVLELKGKAAEKTVVTVENITQRLLNIAEKGEVATDAPLLSVARASLMDAAKLNGLIIDRSKFGFDLTGLSEEELAQLERILARTTKP